MMEYLSNFYKDGEHYIALGAIIVAYVSMVAKLWDFRKCIWRQIELIDEATTFTCDSIKTLGKLTSEQMFLFYYNFEIKDANIDIDLINGHLDHMRENRTPHIDRALNEAFNVVRRKFFTLYRRTSKLYYFSTIIFVVCLLFPIGFKWICNS